MKYLVDANVLSEPTRPNPDGGVVEWLRSNEHEIVVDPLVLGEIRFGILLLSRGRRRTNLERWFREGVGRIRCLPWEAEAGLRWAELLARLRAKGASMPIKDSLLAASALVHGLTVATRNRRDFEKRASRSKIRSCDADVEAAWPHPGPALARREAAPISSLSRRGKPVQSRQWPVDGSGCGSSTRAYPSF